MILKTISRRSVLTISLVLLSLFFAISDVNAQTTTQGGVQAGVNVRNVWKIHQNAFDVATDLHFRVCQKESDIFVNGWKIDISDFTNSNSAPTPDGHGVDVGAGGANIPNCNWVTITVDFWLTKKNTKRIKDAKWTKDGQEKKAVPNHGWTVGDPIPDPLNPGQYLHLLCIANDDTTDYLNVTGLAFTATMTWYADLTQIIFPSPYPNFTLAPGQSWCTNIATSGPLYGGHIYFKFEVRDLASSGNIIEIEVADHPVTEPGVGGIWVPIDKFGLLAPYIGLASTILVATAATAIYVKRVKRRKEKQ